MIQIQNNNTAELQKDLLELLEEKELQVKYNKKDYYFTDTGLFSRHKYPKYMSLMEASNICLEVAVIAGNGTGKTTWGSLVTSCHLTGLYPDWWTGRRFNNAITCWCVGVTHAQQKRVQQKALLGKLTDIGTGMIPKDTIVKAPTMKSGMTGAVEVIYVKHISGDISECIFLASDQGYEIFQGDNVNFIWLDEEPPTKVYNECLARLRDPFNPGYLQATFTPLSGLSTVCQSFLVQGKAPLNGYHPDNKRAFCTQISVYEVPHLSKEYIDTIKKRYPPNELAARLEGVPSLGSGVVFPYSINDIAVEPFKIPEWWPKAYGLDVGWKKTGAIWVTQNPDTKVFYIYDEHYLGMKEIPIHASAIKQKGGKWMRGAIDPSARKTNSNGTTDFDLYEKEGLFLELGNNSVETGIAYLCQLLSSGMLKVFSTCINWLNEYVTYHRDDKDEIARNQADHLLDPTRYVIMSWSDVKSLPPDPDQYRFKDYYSDDRSPITGY